MKIKLERETKLFVTEMLQLIMATAWGTEVSQETGKSLIGSELYHSDQRKDPQDTNLEHLAVLPKAHYTKF